MPGDERHEWTRDDLGRLVREAWVRWARQQPSPKPSWLEPWENLSEPDKEADRQIGQAMALEFGIGWDGERFVRAARERELAAVEDVIEDKGPLPEADDALSIAEKVRALILYAEAGNEYGVPAFQAREKELRERAQIAEDNLAPLAKENYAVKADNASLRARVQALEGTRGVAEEMVSQWTKLANMCDPDDPDEASDRFHDGGAKALRALLEGWPAPSAPDDRSALQARVAELEGVLRKLWEITATHCWDSGLSKRIMEALAAPPAEPQEERPPKPWEGDGRDGPLPDGMTLEESEQ